MSYESMKELTNLAAKVEAVSGPSREMDVLVAQAIWPQLTHYAPHCQGEEPIFWEYPFRKKACPKFTASLDAAMTLVPADWWLESMSDGISASPSGVNFLGCACSLETTDLKSFGQITRQVDGDAATRPLALTAAALRARAALSKKEST